MQVSPKTAEVFQAVEPDVPDLIKTYRARSDRLWMPEELLVPPKCKTFNERREHFRTLHEGARNLDLGVIAAVVLNLLTEEGLPHYHRLLAQHLGYADESPWTTWNNVWTAEEDRHGVVIHDMLRDAHIVAMGLVERLQHQYLSAGFNPQWTSPYMIIAYTVLQERATQMSHGAIGKLAAEVEPTFAKVFKKVAADEARHYGFYLQVLKKLLQEDPSGVIEAIAFVMRNFTMPGRSIEIYEDLAYIQARSDIFGPARYASIIEEVTRSLDLLNVGDLTDTAQQAQQGIGSLPQKLKRIAAREADRSPREISVPFVLSGQTIAV